MKKLILVALMATFVACSGPSTEAAAPVEDTTVVAGDTTAVVIISDSTAVDTTLTK